MSAPMANPNAGALQWEEALRSSETVQQAIPTLKATPESVVYAPAGYVATTIAGDIYVKGTPGNVNTGWKKGKFV